MVEQIEGRKRRILITSATLPYKVLEASRAVMLSYFPQGAVEVQDVCRNGGGLTLQEGGFCNVITVELRGRARERLREVADGEAFAKIGSGRNGRSGSPKGAEWAERFARFDSGMTGGSEGAVWACWESCSVIGDAGNANSSVSLPDRFAGVGERGWKLARGSSEMERKSCVEAELGSDEFSQILRQPRPGRETLASIVLKLVLLKLMAKVTGTELPWGILTGIRPTKLLHRLNDLGVSAQGQRNVLDVLYAVRQDKITLLQGVAAVQAPYLDEQRRDPTKVGIYVGIPFCPSRCTYCSFPGYPLSRERAELRGYLEFLREEVKAAGTMMSANGLEGDTLYFGGGTPSILTELELEELLEVCRAWLPLQKGMELSFEAGRPDTLSEEKLRVLAKLGVTRLSINPQSMQEATLQRIGRAHNAQSVVEAFHTARRLSSWVINMDLIIGLPGEGEAEVRSTLNQLDKLRPDNLTVHALALKRGAKESEWGYEHPDTFMAGQIQALASASARSWGLRPYYLYRQKRMAGNTENIGYALPGKESRYNIAIMEERQSIIGLGAGASSKVVNPADYTLVNFHHPSNWQVYRTSWQNLQAKRVEEFDKVLGQNIFSRS